MRRQVRADGHAHPREQADARAALGDLADFRGFAKTEFTQARGGGAVAIDRNDAKAFAAAGLEEAGFGAGI